MKSSLLKPIFMAAFLPVHSAEAYFVPYQDIITLSPYEPPQENLLDKFEYTPEKALKRISKDIYTCAVSAVKETLDQTTGEIKSIGGKPSFVSRSSEGDVMSVNFTKIQNQEIPAIKATFLLSTQESNILATGTTRVVWDYLDGYSLVDERSVILNASENNTGQSNPRDQALTLLDKVGQEFASCFSNYKLRGFGEGP